MVLATWITRQLVFNGAIAGLGTALVALGVVLTYRSTRIINFAAGNMGLPAAALMALLTINYDVGFWLALTVSLIAGALFAGTGHERGLRFLAWAIFAVASITDRIDGDIARKRGLVTEFGKLADPIADKALVGAALIGLSVLHDLPWWVTVVMLIRELGVTLLRFWVIRHGVIPASRGGKIKTLLQAVALFFRDLAEARGETLP